MLANGKGLRRQASNWGDGAHAQRASHPFTTKPQRSRRGSGADRPVSATACVLYQFFALYRTLRLHRSIEPSGCTGFETSDGPHVQRGQRCKVIDSRGAAESRRKMRRLGCIASPGLRRRSIPSDVPRSSGDAPPPSSRVGIQRRFSQNNLTHGGRQVRRSVERPPVRIVTINPMSSGKCRWTWATADAGRPGQSRRGARLPSAYRDPRRGPSLRTYTRCQRPAGAHTRRRAPGPIAGRKPYRT